MRKKVKNLYLILTILIAFLAFMYGMMLGIYTLAAGGFVYLTFIAAVNDMEDLSEGK